MTTSLARPPGAGGTRAALRVKQQIVEARPIERWRSHVSYRPLVFVATLGAWALATVSWIDLARLTSQGSGLGFDLNISWRAGRLFASGAAPYAVRGFVYPPSSLLLFRPLAALSHADAVLVGLGIAAATTWALVMISAEVVGRRFYGLSAALALWLLHFTPDARGELSLENVSVLCALALALFVLLALRGHWMTAGAILGLSFAIKPLLLVVLLVFIAARQWRALTVTIAVPLVLNVIGFIVVADPGRVWSKLPSILNRVGSGVNLNSAWVDVVRTLGLPEGVSILLRVVTVIVALAAAYLAWTRLADARLKLVSTTSALLLGSYLAGTLSENHFMLTLVPLAMTILIPRSPMRTVTAIVGTVWLMGSLLPSPTLLSLNPDANNSAYRAIGMGLVLLSIGFVGLRQQVAHPIATPALRDSGIANAPSRT